MGEGMAAFTGDVAAAQEEAVWDAKRNAVEQAVGIFLKAKTIGSGFSLEDDEIQGRTQGFVRRWEVIEGSRRIETITTGKGTARVLHIQVQATVRLLALIRRLADIADVYKDLERPRVRVIIAGKAEKKAEKKTEKQNEKSLNLTRSHKKRTDGSLENKPETNTGSKSESQPEAKPEAKLDLDDLAARVQEGIAGALRAQGFDVASEGTAEIVLRGTLDIVPTVHLGDTNAPYGIGDTVCACRANLTLQTVSTASEDVLFTRRVEASGRSFQSDADALRDAVIQLTEAAINANEAQFVPHLLVRWARERQEGHTVVVRAEGLTEVQRAHLKQALSDMRGFRRFVGEQAETKRMTWRFLTRRDTRSIRYDLAAWPLNGSASQTDNHPTDNLPNSNRPNSNSPDLNRFSLSQTDNNQKSNNQTGSRPTDKRLPAINTSAPSLHNTLLVLNDRGPVIECAARSSAVASNAHH